MSNPGISISPDIEQWLLMDEKVVRKWRSLAFRLGLSEYILDIDCWRGGGQASGVSRRRRGSREKDKMELLMKIWRETKPETYNIGILKTVLSAEGLSDMWMWINIITNKSSDGVSPSPASVSTPSKMSGTSGWSRYLYQSDQSSYSQSSYAESDYSLPHSPSSTRPSSQVSYYTSSCPTTPLSTRRLCSSPYRTTQSASSPSPSTARAGVYQTLYRPDLIKLSDPRRRRRNSEDDYESSSVRSVPITMEKNYHRPAGRRNFKNHQLNLASHQPHHLQPTSSKNMHESLEIKNLNRKISDECDQLLKELELDMKNMNSNSNNSFVKNLQTVKKCSQENSVKKLSNYNKQVFYINKVKMVELNDVQLSNEANSFSQTGNNNDVTSLNNNNIMGKSKNQEYFDNLIKLIENAAKNLSE